jgi:hypothetical protein
VKSTAKAKLIAEQIPEGPPPMQMFECQLAKEVPTALTDQ